MQNYQSKLWGKESLQRSWPLTFLSSTLLQLNLTTWLWVKNVKLISRISVWFTASRPHDKLFFKMDFSQRSKSTKSCDKLSLMSDITKCNLRKPILKVNDSMTTTSALKYSNLPTLVQSAHPMSAKSTLKVDFLSTYPAPQKCTLVFHPFRTTLLSKRNATFLKLPFFWRRVYTSEFGVIHVTPKTI